MSPNLQKLLSIAEQTWPVRLAHDFFDAVKLPGDVYSGRAAVPQSAAMPGGENTDNLGRVLDLAGMVMGGTYGSAPSGALGAGFVPQTRSQVARTTTRLQKLLDQAGVSYQRDTSRVSPSEYFYVDTPAGDTVKARISQHADRYGSDFSVAPGDSGFDDLLSYLRDQGVSIPDRVSSAATKFANAKAALGQKWAYSTWHGLDDEAQQLAKQIQAVSNPQELAKAQNAFDDLTQRSADNFRDTTGIEPTGKMFIDSMIYRRAAGEIDDQAVRNWFAKHSPEIQGQVSGMLDNLSAPANH